MKKLIALLLALVMVIGLVACGGNGNTTTTTEPDSNSNENNNDNNNEEKLYIPVMAKGFQHQFWKAVASGAEAAAKEYDVEIYFNGPASETEIQAQVDMIQKEMAKNPKAMALAALDTEAVGDILADCADKGIPVIGFDSGVPGDTSGAVKATASTNNENAAAIAAEKFGEHEGLVAAMKAATVENPVRIACLSQDAVSASVTGRTTGFVNKMKEVASQYGTVAVVGHDKWAEGDASAASIIIEVSISATTEATDVQNASAALLAKEDLIALFCSNEGVVTGFLAATTDGEDLGKGGKYDGLVVAGFDAGAAQKNAIRQGYFYGSVTQDPYRIGYLAVELAVKAAKGEAVADVDTGAQWYNADNIDDEMIAMLVYD